MRRRLAQDAAELTGLAVQHLDKGFDLIAEVTGQPMERLNVDQTDLTDNGADQTGA